MVSSATRMIRNIAAYKFARLDGLKDLRARLLSLCKQTELKGTILLSGEGINLFVAGTPDGIDSLLRELRSIRGLEDLQVKVSESEHQPFNRMLVRIKKEIIAFGVPGIDPASHTSPKISARELKQWLDEGRPVTLLDTRNDYEVRLGTFQNAIPAGIDQFREFPNAVRKLPAELKERPIVMFCTGGIRCEKAGPFMEREGFRNVLQLDGGILKYFEECGGAHYHGECFVFDQRVGLDPSLHESASAQCFRCLSPLAAEEQADSRYVPGQSCPYCFKTTEEQMRENIARRHKSLEGLIVPLPGSVAYDNFRPISVPSGLHGAEIRIFLSSVLPHVDWEEAFRANRICDSTGQSVEPSRRVQEGERYLHKLERIVEPPVHARFEILHEDEALIVLNKPAPLPMHPSGRFNRNTLQHLLNLLYYPQKPRPAHRLDANTTGVLLVTRTRHFAARLQPQFARGEVLKRYVARVQGRPATEQFTVDAPISASPSEVGTREIDFEAGLPARTEFRVLRSFADGSTLLEARPLTGRTNQIRVHLWQMDLPVMGDQVYLPGRNLGGTQTLLPEDPPLCLHAAEITFTHPLSNQSVRFSTPSPDWARV
jgi:UPF0176 protein